MEIKCNYCGEIISDEDEKCSKCGCLNKSFKHLPADTPKTIQQLKQWYINKNLPDENITRFFIDKDYTSPKAFGIYKDEFSGHFIVYKNKDTGERVIHYKGPDELYAVNELYLKLKSEIHNQKDNNKRKKETRINRYRIIIASLCGVILLFSLITPLFGPKKGYYRYDNDYYYYQNRSWYGYDSSSGWRRTSAPYELRNRYSSYYDSSSYNSNYNIRKFEDSSYYSSSSWFFDSSWKSSSDSWDSSDSWNSGTTDWSSDW